MKFVEDVDEGDIAPIGAPLENRLLEGLRDEAITPEALRYRVANILQAILAVGAQEAGAAIIADTVTGLRERLAASARRDGRGRLDIRATWRGRRRVGRSGRWVRRSGGRGRVAELD